VCSRLSVWKAAAVSPARGDWRHRHAAPVWLCPSRRRVCPTCRAVNRRKESPFAESGVPEDGLLCALVGPDAPSRARSTRSQG